MKRAERLRRFVDGELSTEEQRRLRSDAAEDRELGALLDEASATREALRTLQPVEACSPSLAARSLRAAHAARPQPEATPAARMKKLLSPRWVRWRLSPALTLLPVAAAALIWVAGRHMAEPVAAPLASTSPNAQEAEPEPEAPPTPDDVVPIRFVLPAEGAHSVAVAGDFNGWDVEDIELADTDGDGVFVGTAYLPHGDWTYMFVVDGTRWVSDPYAQSFRDDGFGGRNAVLRIN
jgi:anti-sigma factor RsiW